MNNLANVSEAAQRIGWVLMDKHPDWQTHCHSMGTIRHQLFGARLMVPHEDADSIAWLDYLRDTATDLHYHGRDLPYWGAVNGRACA